MPSEYDNWKINLPSGLAQLWWNATDNVYQNDLTDGIFHKDQEYTFFFEPFTDQLGQNRTHTSTEFYDSFNSLQGDLIPVIWT